MSAREPRALPLAARQAVFHDAGVEDRELAVEGTRWALVEYAAGSERAAWCDTPHCGYVVSGTVSYEFEDGRPALLAEAGSALLLPPAPRHRGSCPGPAPARLFLIDSLPAPRE